MCCGGRGGGGCLAGLSPPPVRCAAASRSTVSELSRTVGRPAGVEELLLEHCPQPPCRHQGQTLNPLLAEMNTEVQRDSVTYGRSPRSQVEGRGHIYVCLSLTGATRLRSHPGDVYSFFLLFLSSLTSGFQIIKVTSLTSLRCNLSSNTPG